MGLVVQPAAACEQVDEAAATHEITALESSPRASAGPIPRSHGSSRRSPSCPTTVSDLGRVRTPALVLQCDNDVIAPLAVGDFVRDTMPNTTLVTLHVSGHCPHLSAPDQTIAAIKDFLRT
jgi:pimeloyl-ACP methyl ester carboxylesterase